MDRSVASRRPDWEISSRRPSPTRLGVYSGSFSSSSASRDPRASTTTILSSTSSSRIAASSSKYSWAVNGRSEGSVGWRSGPGESPPQPPNTAISARHIDAKALRRQITIPGAIIHEPRLIVAARLWNGMAALSSRSRRVRAPGRGSPATWTNRAGYACSQSSSEMPASFSIRHPCRADWGFSVSGAASA